MYVYILSVYRIILICNSFCSRWTISRRAKRIWPNI